MDKRNDLFSLGERLREERLKQNYTQEALAEAVGLTPAFIGHIERGERSISVETLIKFSKVLEVSTDYLLRDVLLTTEEVIVEEFKACLWDKKEEQQRALLDIVRTASKYI